MKPLVTPLININGNTADDLIDKLKNVLQCARLLGKAMIEANDIVHGRNFQTHADQFAARAEANDAWRERQNFVANLEEEIRRMASEVQAQKR